VIRVNWDRVLPTAVGVALVEGIILGYVFSAFSGAGFVLEYWALLAVIVGVIVLVGALITDRIARQRVTGPTAARLALIIGPVLGLAAGYLLQFRGGPT
jgi:uncharacterized membrane protein YfcA